MRFRATATAASTTLLFLMFATAGSATGFQCMLKPEQGGAPIKVTFAPVVPEVVPGKLNLRATSEAFAPMIGASSRNYRKPKVLMMLFTQEKMATEGPHGFGLEIARNQSAQMSLQGKKMTDPPSIWRGVCPGATPVVKKWAK